MREERGKLSSFREFFIKRKTSAVFGATILIIGNVVSKSLSFFINIYIARKIDSSLFGVGFVSIALITTLSQSLNKKCFRRVALHDVNTQRNDLKMQSSVNVSWLSVLSTMTLSTLLCVIWIYRPPENVLSRPELMGSYSASVILAGFSSVIESLVEPLIFDLIKKDLVFMRSFVEILSGISRSLVLLYAVRSERKNLDILYFPLGQLTYSIVYLLFTLLICTFSSSWFMGENQAEGTRNGNSVGRDEISSLLPKKLRDYSINCNNGSFYSIGKEFTLEQHSKLLRQFFLTCIQSTIFQEADKILVLSLFSSKEWSNFGIISNLANIATRVFFSPIEDIATERFKNIKFNFKSKNVIGHISTQLSPLRQLLFITTCIGVNAISFGPPISSELINIIYGPKWVNQNNILLFSANLYLLSLLSLHGIMESLLFSLGGVLQVSKYRKMSLGLFFIHIFNIFIFRDKGCIAILFSNSFTLTTQIIYCFSFIFSLIKPAFNDKNKLLQLVRSIPILFIENDSRPIYLLVIFGGIVQRLTLFFIKNLNHSKTIPNNPIFIFIVSFAIALFTSIASIPPFLKILKTTQLTNTH
ncbi:conserved hypothetical multi-pass transmembrane [Cryptosporidium bovis]|uniref:conserved hypothetical multi-pass transmembrane n=1 Tax=Cryptosporidium bovis TaxID=310047 RepID=UPI00351A817F|nr:conserved hypothetical multi-pass transmembrane [Cryptosporidium bovis]